MKGKQLVPVLVMLGGVTLATAVALIVFLPYFEPEIPTPAPDAVTWSTYTDAAVGFAVDVPDTYELDASPGGTVWRFGNAAVVHVAWIDEDEGRRRGLWPNHEPVSTVELGGRPGRKYIYNHYDAIAGVKTHAWVVPHRGRQLGLELRTRRASMLESFGFAPRTEIGPDETARRIVESFRFLASAGESAIGEPLSARPASRCAGARCCESRRPCRPTAPA